jgi:SAM-dependent methyltransferase
MHDSYWRFGRPAFFALLPAPGHLTLDVGCGEGRVSRDLAALGHRVIGIDASRSMVDGAIAAAPQIPALVADAAAMPLASGCSDLVVAYMSLQDVDDMPRAIREIGRVLVPGGRLCMAIVHPINSAGQFESLDPAAPFVIEGSYLDSYQYADEIERDGLRMTFASIHHPLEAYFKALETAGFVTETLHELPIPEGLASDASPRHDRWRRIPLFLHLRAVKV